MRVLLLALLLAVPAALTAAATEHPPGPARPGPGVAIIVHHPHPDAADPFGFAWPEGSDTDAFAARHMAFRQGAFPYPSVVFDGVVPILGPVADGDPQQATDAAYREEVERRAAVAAPVVLQVAAAAMDDTARIRVWATPVQPLPAEDLHLWVALVEDPVHYRPPAGLTNGVFDHPFTLRAIADAGQLDLRGDTVTDHAFPLADWDPSRLHAVVWVQQDGTGPGGGGRFARDEVVQSTMHRLGGGITRQEEKGVLVEMLSATWCDPCLFGDRAVEHLAQAYGVPLERERDPAAGTLRLPPAWPLAVLAALAFGLVLARLPREAP